MTGPLLLLSLFATSAAPCAPATHAAPAMTFRAAPAPTTDESPKVIFVDGPEVRIEDMILAEVLGARRGHGAVRVDTTLEAAPGTGLVLSIYAGDIAVDSWDRSAVRIQAERGARDRIVARMRNGALVIGAVSPTGPAFVDWKLTVPRWMPLQLKGIEGGIDVTGLQASLKAQSFKGDVTVRACSGPLEVSSVEGEVRISDANGIVSAGSVNNLIHLERVTGPVTVQTINGDIQMHSITSINVEASTVNGRVVYSSSFQPRGRYQLTSHNGTLVVGVPDNAPLDVSVASFNGEFRTSFPLPPTPPVPPLPGIPPTPHAKRFRFALGQAGVAVPQLDLESYQGLIQLLNAKDMRILADSVRRFDVGRYELDRRRMKLERVKLRKHESLPPKPPTPEEEDD